MSKFDYCPRCASIGLGASPLTWQSWNGQQWVCDACAERLQHEANGGNIIPSLVAKLAQAIVDARMPAASKFVETARGVLDNPNAPLAMKQTASAVTVGATFLALGQKPKRAGRTRRRLKA